MKTIYLVRHEVCGGRGYIGSGSDVALTKDGARNAALTAERLGRMDFDIIYTSPMRRCMETARPIAAEDRLEPVLRAELTELNFGRWEGRSYEEIHSESPDTLDAWLASPGTVPPPGGENLAQMYERVGNFWNECAERGPESKILIVSHAGPIRTILSILSGGGIENHWAFGIERGRFCIIKMYDDGKCQITGTNFKSIAE